MLDKTKIAMMKSNVKEEFASLRNEGQEKFESSAAIMVALCLEKEARKFHSLIRGMVAFLCTEEGSAIGICTKEEAKRIVEMANGMCMKILDDEADETENFKERIENENEQNNKRNASRELYDDANRETEEADTVCADAANDGSSDSI